MEWKEYSLGDISKLKYGKNVSAKLCKGPVPIFSGYRKIGTCNTINCKKNTVIVIARGVGGCGDVKLTKEDCFLTNLSISVELDKGICNAKWFYYNHLLNNLSFLNSGSAQPQITIDSLSKYLIRIPPIIIQRKIAGILSALDAKIENNNKINGNLEAQAQALFKSWFVDFTPFKDQPFVDSELGPIPQGWKVGTLGDIANIIMGQSPAGSSYNERGNGVIFYQGRTEFGFRFPNVRLYTTMPKRYAEPMSILLSVRAPVGDINVAIEKCCIGRGLASISSKRGLHSFLLYLVKSLKNRLEVFNGEGTVFGSINKNTLTQFKIIIPPIEMQEKFNEIIQRHDCMVLELHKEIINLSTQRDTLLPKLMSGEIKL